MPYPSVTNTQRRTAKTRRKLFETASQSVRKVEQALALAREQKKKGAP